jgi:hypothetical protein
LLVISRHLPRETAGAIEAKLQDALALYFLRPVSLLGSLAFHFEELSYSGTTTTLQDVVLTSE